MFEELCRLSGTVRLRTGEYADGKPVWAERPCTYFPKQETFRDPEGTLQSRTQFFCKGLGAESLDASAVFVDAAGAEHALEGAKRIDNVFENEHEFWLLTAVR